MTRLLLISIFVVPTLWIWPQRGFTMAFYANPQWSGDPVLVRVERNLNLDFMTAGSFTTGVSRTKRGSHQGRPMGIGDEQRNSAQPAAVKKAARRRP